MRNKIIALIISLITVFSLLTGTISISADTNTVGEAQSLVDGIMVYKSGSSSNTQSWINGGLKKNAGTSSEWYILGLAQNGSYDFSSYEAALKNYLSNNTVYSATSRQKYALVLMAIGSADSYISSVLEDSIGNQGIMSWVYGLHMLNNGYRSSKTTAAQAKQTLLSLQLGDGGWALKGSTGDVDVTAMAVQSLAPYYYSDASVQSAVNSALNLLSSRQLETGAYSSYGVPNPESTAQVLTALSSLGIDCATDSRFIKNGNTLLDGINQFKLADGSFCHKTGEGSNETATVQVFYAMIAYLRMSRGQNSLYILDHRNPGALAPLVTAVPNNDTVKPTEGTSDSQQNQNTNSRSNGNNQSNIGSNNQQGGQDSNDDQSDEVSGTNVTNTPEGSVSPSQSPKPSESSTPEVFAEGTKNPDTTSVVNVTASASEPKPEDEKIEPGTNKGISYKLWVSLGIALAAIVTSVILFLKGKKNKKNFIVIGILAVVLILAVCITDFQTADDYYNGEDAIKTETVGTVSLTIRCDTVAGKSDSEYIPEDGIVLETTEFEIEENDTVYDILVEAAKKYQIQMENTGAEGMVYIAGINYLYEFDFGDLSGWMYFVNDEEPSVGCDDYVLKDGDKIEWLYTCELGNDLTE